MPLSRSCRLLIGITQASSAAADWAWPRAQCPSTARGAERSRARSRLAAPAGQAPTSPLRRSVAAPPARGPTLAERADRCCLGCRSLTVAWGNYGRFGQRRSRRAQAQGISPHAVTQDVAAWRGGARSERLGLACVEALGAAGPPAVRVGPGVAQAGPESKLVEGPDVIWRLMILEFGPVAARIARICLDHEA